MADRTHQDRRAVCDLIDRISKYWWGIAMCTRLAAFVVGIAGVFLQSFSTAAPFILAILTVAAELCLLRSERLRGIAQRLNRALELEDGLGWDVSKVEFTDILARGPSSAEELRAPKDQEPYFASTKTPGAERLVDNLAESSWWSKHLAESMRALCLITMVVVTGTVIALLIISIQALQPTNVEGVQRAQEVSRVVTAALLMIFSLGLLKLALAYHSFAQKAATTDTSAQAQSGKAMETSAIKLLHEYQLARASAPPLPGWIWKLRRKSLNRLWEYRTKPNDATAGQ